MGVPYSQSVDWIQTQLILEKHFALCSSPAGTRISLPKNSCGERMKSRILWSSSVTIICLIPFLGLKGVQAETIECYSCIDRGEGACLPDRAVNVSCPPDYDMCVETITAIKTSHDNHVVLSKGCGYGGPTMLEKNILSYGLSIYMQLNQCNTSLCNTNMDLKHYHIAPDENITQVPNDDQCYSCIGTPKAECSPSSAPVKQCYDAYNHCFDGNVTISTGNATTTIPLKSCSTRYHCGKHTITYGSVTVEMIGSCCSECLCNNDLSNQTHLAELPYLVLLNDRNEEHTVKVVPPNFVSATPEPNITHENRSLVPKDYNVANGLSFSRWLSFILITLSFVNCSSLFS